MSSCVLGVMPVSGDMPVVWRMAPVLSGQIRCWLVVFLLAAVLPRTEPGAEGRDAAGDSVNKALVDSLVPVMGDGKLLLPGRGGSERRKMQAEAACSDAGLYEVWCSMCWSSLSATQGSVLPAYPKWISAMVGMAADVRSGCGAYGDEIGDGPGCDRCLRQDPELARPIQVAYRQDVESGACTWEVEQPGLIIAPLNATMEMPSLSNHAMELLVYAQRRCNILELDMVLQILHMRFSHCSGQFENATPGWCCTNCHGNLRLDTLGFLSYVFDQISEANSSLKNISKCCLRMLGLLQHRRWHPRARTLVSTSSSSKLHCYLSGCGALYPLQAAMYDAYVFLLFGIRRRWVRASLLRILGFNGQDPLD